MRCLGEKIKRIKQVLQIVLQPAAAGCKILKKNLPCVQDFEFSKVNVFGFDEAIMFHGIRDGTTIFLS